MYAAPSASPSRSQRPDRKRPRLDLDDDEVRVLDNHPTLYFDDGNVILSCGTILFCVHRSLLAKHSPVFQRMFTPVDGVKPDMLRGCRHYSVDDSREDMEALLEMIYNGLRVESVTLTAETFPVLSSLLHMCTKYEVERPRPEIVARIQACWPDNLAQHDAVNDARVRKYMDAHANQYPQGTILPYVDDDTDVHPAAIIALLRQCGYTEPKLFAPLFYALSRCAKGFGGVAGSNISPLSHTDVERLLVGIERLRADHLKKTVVVLTGEPAHANYCGAALATFSSTRLSLAAAQALSSPVEFWGGAAKLIMQAAGQPPAAPCAVCCTLVANSILEGRNALWARMPEVFDLS